VLKISQRSFRVMSRRVIICDCFYSVFVLKAYNLCCLMTIKSQIWFQFYHVFLNSLSCLFVCLFVCLSLFHVTSLHVFFEIG
jgi:hypothetical protein